MAVDPRPSTARAYQVALSYASEDGEYVDAVARALHRAGVDFFYDKYKVVDLWGTDLYEHLDRVYSKDADYTVMFVSQHYATKVWTNHERKSAQARAFEERRDYILPARFDDTELPGLPKTIFCMDLRQKGPEELAELIIRKIGHTPLHPPEGPSGAASVADKAGPEIHRVADPPLKPIPLATAIRVEITDHGPLYLCDVLSRERLGGGPFEALTKKSFGSHPRYLRLRRRDQSLILETRPDLTDVHQSLILETRPDLTDLQSNPSVRSWEITSERAPNPVSFLYTPRSRGQGPRFAVLIASGRPAVMTIEERGPDSPHSLEVTIDW
jgi:hypothetical protein